MQYRSAEEYLRKNNSFDSEELLDFVISQCSSIEMYLSVAPNIRVSMLLL